MPGKSPKQADAKASGKSKAARDGKPGAGESPFVGRSIHIAFDPQAEPSARLDCVAHVGDFLCVRGHAGDVWVNLNRVAQVVIAGDPDADAPSDPLTAALKPLEAKYGPITVDRKDGPQEAS